MSFTVIRDTREHENYGWDFTSDGLITINKKLNTGDYSIEGMERILCIERKRSSGEIATNIGKKGKPWKAELDRMLKIKYPFILCEFSLDTLMKFPEGSTIPRSKWQYLRMNAKFMASCLMSYKEKYNVDVIFCQDESEARAKALEILRVIYEKERLGC